MAVAALGERRPVAALSEGAAALPPVGPVRAASLEPGAWERREASMVPAAQPAWVEQPPPAAWQVQARVELPRVELAVAARLARAPAELAVAALQTAVLAVVVRRARLEAAAPHRVLDVARLRRLRAARRRLGVATT
jgi:hypothetical protein